MNRNVVFIAFFERENLGIAYLTSVLKSAGFRVLTIDIRTPADDLYRQLSGFNPCLVGFSVVYQSFINDFIGIVAWLREKGVSCHFTAGGHYASLRTSELFRLIPGIDSCVLFEGELTIVELAGKITEEKSWKHVKGLAYRQGDSVVRNQLRPLETDLDSFPFPERSQIKEFALGKKYAGILSGRGCVHDCSFCDIREFYGPPPGPLKRLRKPGEVVREMAWLYNNHACSVFLFQDDDFPLVAEGNSEWAGAFCSELRRSGLAGKIMWKINCRPDEVDGELFEMMKYYGLFKVYLGIEDGTDEGLQRLGKGTAGRDNLEGISTLKKLGIRIDYGFMLFQPETDYASLRVNLSFLRQICGDGYMPLCFLKLLPYFETRVEKKLRREGRLKGSHGALDYDFAGPSLNNFYYCLTASLGKWLNDTDGFLNLSKWTRNFISLISFFEKKSLYTTTYSCRLDRIIADANNFLLDSIGSLSIVFENKGVEDFEEVCRAFRHEIDTKHAIFISQLQSLTRDLLFRKQLGFMQL